MSRRHYEMVGFQKYTSLSEEKENAILYVVWDEQEERNDRP